MGITYIIYLCNSIYRFLQHTFGPSILSQFPYETRRKTGVGEEIWNSRWWRWGPPLVSNVAEILGWRAVAGVPRVICVVGLYLVSGLLRWRMGLDQLVVSWFPKNRWDRWYFSSPKDGRQNTTCIPQKSPCQLGDYIQETPLVGGETPTYFSGWNHQLEEQDLSWLVGI